MRPLVFVNALALFCVSCFVPKIQAARPIVVVKLRSHQKSGFGAPDF